MAVQYKVFDLIRGKSHIVKGPNPEQLFAGLRYFTQPYHWVGFTLETSSQSEQVPDAQVIFEVFGQVAGIEAHNLSKSNPQDAEQRGFVVNFLMIEYQYAGQSRMNSSPTLCRFIYYPVPRTGYLLNFPQEDALHIDDGVVYRGIERIGRLAQGM